MAICPKCGSQVPEGNLFCTGCGAPAGQASSAPKTGTNKALIIGIIGAVIAVILIVIILLVVMKPSTNVTPGPLINDSGPATGPGAEDRGPPCGNGDCESTETCTSCSQDCGTCLVPCGDGERRGAETCSNCPADCGTCQAPPETVCGDDNCDSGETCTSCSQDCGACPPACGDSKCNGGETCTSCPQDCGACPTEICGNNKCAGVENCSNCPKDCGYCLTNPVQYSEHTLPVTKATIEYDEEWNETLEDICEAYGDDCIIGDVKIQMTAKQFVYVMDMMTCGVQATGSALCTCEDSPYHRHSPESEVKHENRANFVYSTDYCVSEVGEDCVLTGVDVEITTAQDIYAPSLSLADQEDNCKADIQVTGTCKCPS